MNENGTNPDILQVQGRMIRGYGIIPKIAMQDRRLTPEAKCIYSYFCSFAGAGSTAFPSRDKILYDLQIGLKRYYKHFNLLKQYGYIEVAQNGDSTGQFKNNIYTLVEMLPCSQNDHTAPCGRFAHTPDAHTPDDHTKNNVLKNNNFINNISEKQQSVLSVLSIQNSMATPNTEDQQATTGQMTDTKPETTKKEKEPSDTAPTKARGSQESPKSFNIADYTTYQRIIQDNIGYEYFLGSDRSLIDNFIQVMLDVITTASPDTVKIGDEVKSREIVSNIYLKLNHGHIELALNQFLAQHHQITHKTAYIKVLLLSSFREIDLHYTNQVKADFTT